MASIRQPESIGKLAKTSTTTVSLPASRLNIGGQQYVTTSALSLSVATSGVGGLDATVVASSIYTVYAAVSGGAVSLVGSLNATIPAGFTQARVVGILITDSFSQVDRALFFGQSDSELVSGQMAEKAKNLIINGNMDFWQRGTTISMAANSNLRQFLADRWDAYTDLASGTLTYSRSTDVPNTQSLYSLSIQATSTVANGTTNFTTIEHPLEGNVLRSIAGKTATLSFWTKAWAAGTYSVVLANSAGTRSIVKEYVVSAANTWEFKTITFTHDTTGSWSYDNTRGMRMFFVLGCGTSNTVAPNVWATRASVTIASSNQTPQIFSASGNTFKLSQVMLNEGSSAAPFQLAGGNIAGELNQCQRYYEIVSWGGLAYGTTRIGTSSRWAVTKCGANTAQYFGDQISTTGPGNTNKYNLANVGSQSFSGNFQGLGYTQEGYQVLSDNGASWSSGVGSYYFGYAGIESEL